MAIAWTGAVAVPVVCCAGSGLLVAGVLDAIGAVLASPWVIAAAALLAAGVVALRVHRYRACGRKDHPGPGDQRRRASRSRAGSGR